MNEMLVGTFPEVGLPQTSNTKYECERLAFYRLLPLLLTTHRDQYVAIHNGQVVDSGMDRKVLVSRTLDRVQADIYVGLVSAEPQTEVCSAIRRVAGPSRRSL